MIGIPDFFRGVIIDHYNKTTEYYHKNPNTNEMEMVYYKEPIEQTIIADSFVVGLLVYILYNL